MTVWGKIIIGDSRNMAEVADGSIGLVVTSPPYWHLKDYGVPGQIGYGQTLHEYLLDLSRVWRECWRVLMPGRRLCINIGDQFARAVIYGRYKVIPLHAEIIAQCETIGLLLRFDRPPQAPGAPVPAYLYLTNKLFVNRKMIEMGLADADRAVWHRYRDKFLEAEAQRNGERMGAEHRL